MNIGSLYMGETEAQRGPRCTLGCTQVGQGVHSDFGSLLGRRLSYRLETDLGPGSLPAGRFSPQLTWVSQQLGPQAVSPPFLGGRWQAAGLGVNSLRVKGSSHLLLLGYT